jgi:micrococcal nuclease
MRSGLGLAILLWVAEGHAAEALQWSEPVAVARVIAGDLVQLAEGPVVRLAGIRVPVGDAGLAEAARAALADLIGGQSIRLGLADAPYDRHGQLVAQVERAGLWLQEALLERGLALVQTRPGEVARAERMLAVEQVARSAGRGVWAGPGFAPREAGAVQGAIGSFQIVRGRVVRVAPTERYVYLNFGADWRTDFTIRARRAELKGALAGLDLEALAGHRVEIRGVVLEAGGPLIELSHPEQMQVLP